MAELALCHFPGAWGRRRVIPALSLGVLVVPLRCPLAFPCRGGSLLAGTYTEQPLLIGLARPAPCANFSRRSGRNPSEVCVEPQNRQRHYMASPIPKHAKYQPGCGPGNMILKHSLLLNFIKNPTITRHIRTPPGDEPWATEPPRKTSSPAARMHHMM